MDKIARQNDIAYTRATTVDDITKADITFLKQVSEHSSTSLYDWIVKQIAHHGINIKYIIEQKIGILKLRNKIKSHYLNTQKHYLHT